MNGRIAKMVRLYARIHDLDYTVAKEAWKRLNRKERDVVAAEWRARYGK